MIQECDRVSIGRKPRRRNPTGGFIEHLAYGKFKAGLVSDSPHHGELAIRRPIGGLCLGKQVARSAAAERDTSENPRRLQMRQPALGVRGFAYDGEFSLWRDGQQPRTRNFELLRTGGPQTLRVEIY